MEKFENKRWIHKADLIWIVNGKEKEVIMSNQPYAYCRKKKAELERTTHYKIGKLVVISRQSKDRQQAIDKELK